MESPYKNKLRKVRDLISSFVFYFVLTMLLYWLAGVLFYGETFSMDSFIAPTKNEIDFYLFFAAIMTFLGLFDKDAEAKTTDQ